MSVISHPVEASTSVAVPPAFDPLVDTPTAAGLLGVHPVSLKKARVYGGPLAIEHVRIGRRVRYRMSVLAAYVARNTAFRTSDPVTA